MVAKDFNICTCVGRALVPVQFGGRRVLMNRLVFLSDRCDTVPRRRVNVSTKIRQKPIMWCHIYEKV